MNIGRYGYFKMLDANVKDICQDKHLLKLQVRKAFAQISQIC